MIYEVAALETYANEWYDCDNDRSVYRPLCSTIRPRQVDLKAGVGCSIRCRSLGVFELQIVDIGFVVG